MYFKFYKIKILLYIGTQLGRYDQCGGKGYNGSTTCVSGLTCYMVNSDLFQCSPSCQKYWQCQGNGKIILILQYSN